jgi:7,8-dihydropterin-6-yl-methyl-4-(beta-D-ribofuranosyl)aminobenzene 5'-phosphate synthase
MIQSEELRITTIIENSTASSETLGEWGFSALVEAGPRTFLLDAGTSEATVRNADRLALDLEKIDAIVLSHGHYDHTGGLKSVLERIHRPEIRIIAHPGVLDSKYGYNRRTNTYRYAGIPFRQELLEHLGARFEFDREPVWLTEDIVSSGEEPMTTDFESVAANLKLKEKDRFVQDPMADDQSLYIRTELGLIVMLGCAHRGMINIITHARKLMDTERVHMVIGGTHLSRASEEQVDKTVQSLKEMDVRWLGVSHCTGLEVAARLAGEFPGRFFFNTAGTVIQFPFPSTRLSSP